MTPRPVFGDPPLANQSLIAIVDLEQHAIIRTIQHTVGFDFGQLAWSPDGAHITAIGPRAWDGSANSGQGAYLSGLDTVMVFDAHSGNQITGEQLEDIARTSLRYTPDGKYLIEGVMNGRGSGLGVQIWDGQHRELLQVIPGEVSGLAVSRDGHYLAVGEVGKTIVWQLKY
jgi:WD40 repeat protein